ncbi:MAG: hypothetical protein P8Q46_04145 [Candidatus Thalassarchaeaceae archaeon]|nr:hypothetical protein [Candidatus Thalassarchaeaceae archaeon]
MTNLTALFFPVICRMTIINAETRERLFVLWLVLSAFGIMFVVLPWAQEAGLLPSSSEMGAMKEPLALLSGLALYGLVAHNMAGGPGDN